MWKDLIRPYVRPLPQWSAVGVTAPQQAVTASLIWKAGCADVTMNHTVASLVPLTIAVGLDAGRGARLEYRDRRSGRLIGELELQSSSKIGDIRLYRVTSGFHHCLSWPMRPWCAWLQNRAIRRNRSPKNFYMDPVAVQQLMIAYLCPRPVVLVSVATPRHANIFPMDLIGPLGNGFSLALRSTNISVPVMRECRQVVLSSAPAHMKQVVYALGGHHKASLTDWDSLPFPLRMSRTFGLPAVATALRVREIDIEHIGEIGSHTFFFGRIISDEPLAEGRQLHHTAGFYQHYRQRVGDAFEDAAAS